MLELKGEVLTGEGGIQESDSTLFCRNVQPRLNIIPVHTDYALGLVFEIKFTDFSFVSILSKNQEAFSEFGV